MNVNDNCFSKKSEKADERDRRKKIGASFAMREQEESGAGEGPLTLPSARSTSLNPSFSAATREEQSELGSLPSFAPSRASQDELLSLRYFPVILLRLSAHLS